MKSFWFNLPVKDIDKSKEFYSSIGFIPNPQYPDGQAGASFFLGATKVVMMLFPEEVFEGFAANKVSDANASTEVLFNIDAESRAEVDEMAIAVITAGGKIFAAPEQAQGWMYALGFADPDGHRWNVLFMDMEKMPQ